MALINKTDPKPFIELTEIAKKEMDDIKDSLDRADGDIEALKSVGFNVDKLQEMVDMGKRMHAVVIKRFTP